MYSHEVSQQTIYNMEILSLKHVRDDALRIGIQIEFHSLGAVYEYDLSNKEERDFGTADAPSTDIRSVRLWVSATGFSKSVIYLGVKFFMTLYVKMAFLYLSAPHCNVSSTLLGLLSINGRN